MNALVFGGESPRHRQWVRDTAAALGPHFETVRYFDYRHWDENNSGIHLEHEITQAHRLAEGLEDYVIVAKSIGTVVAASAIGRNLIQPKKCVFLGFPLGLVTKSLPEVSRSLGMLPFTDFVQNELDKVGTAEALRVYLDEVEPPEYRFRSVKGNATHDYVDMDLIVRLAALAEQS